MPGGIPAATRQMIVKFHYNNIESIRAAFARHLGQIACLTTEAERTEPSQGSFLQDVKSLCEQNGALFILLDEIIAGFRWHLGGAKKLH